MRKLISTLLIASFVLSPLAAANVQAASLGSLLGAQHHAAASAPGNTDIGSQSAPPAQDFASADAGRRGTVRFPVLSRVIKLIIFVLLRTKK